MRCWKPRSTATRQCVSQVKADSGQADCPTTNHYRPNAPKRQGPVVGRKQLLRLECLAFQNQTQNAATMAVTGTRSPGEAEATPAACTRTFVIRKMRYFPGPGAAKGMLPKLSVLLTAKPGNILGRPALPS